MTDVVVTVPKDRWEEWIAEGEVPGDDHVECPDCFWRGTRPEWRGHIDVDWGEPCPVGTTDLEWDFAVGGGRPDIEPGERVYVVAHGRLRGYAPLTRVREDRGGVSLVRRGDAVAVTIPEPITGFRGWRYRWWDRAIEQPFPDWRTP